MQDLYILNFSKDVWTLACFSCAERILVINFAGIVMIGFFMKEIIWKGNTRYDAK